MTPRQIAVGITGASGAIYAGRLLRILLAQGHIVHLVMSKYGRYLLHEELGFQPDRESVVQFLARLYGPEVERGELRQHGVNDLTCPISSGSVPLDGSLCSSMRCVMRSLVRSAGSPDGVLSMYVSDPSVERPSDRSGRNGVS